MYLDDIVVYSQNLDDHVRHLRLVLEQLRVQLYLKLEKCVFTQEEVMFLGHRVGYRVIKMDDQKVLLKEDGGLHQTSKEAAQVGMDRKLLGGLSKVKEERHTKRFWLEGGILYAKGRRMYVPNGGELKKELLRECHNAPAHPQPWLGDDPSPLVQELLLASYGAGCRTLTLCPNLLGVPAREDGSIKAS
ncbi:hypothetical protein AMTR_s00157p00058850 [Amborella trichopoda]|uniref:Reverse transcriptase domain-containing protein n=1 Tax=Amborella trichopoda TaxID=13333 RepID=W1PHW8_AMBTC|nr:hypothetical protein AMTR_s00157p00058850 [Amborella trichopoda]